MATTAGARLQMTVAELLPGAFDAGYMVNADKDAP